jgi:septum site-determining protein MinC
VSGEAVSIKGTKNGLVIIFNPDLDPEDIKNNLQLKMEKSKGFFKGAKFTFYHSPEERSLNLMDELEGICRQYGLIPSKEVSWPPESRSGEQPGIKKKQSPVVPLRQPKAGEEQATLIYRTVRSGQKITSGSSLFILGDVNPGAEIISGGSVYIMGNCRGMVSAGCGGDILAEVFAFRFQPPALRIGTISTESGWPADSGPHVARVSRGKIIFNRFSNNTMPAL